MPTCIYACMATEQQQAQKSRIGSILRMPLLVGKWLARGIAAIFAVWIGLAGLYSIVDPPTTILAASEHLRLGETKREWIEFEDVPPHVHRALVAAEDANFCLHWGIDPNAVRNSIVRGGNLSASTISQQTASIVMLWPSESKAIRLPETLIAFGIEAFWSKRRVLEIYMNFAEFGEGVFGIQAAATENFGLDASELDLDQASRLAAVLMDPRNMVASDLSPEQARRAALIADGASTIDRDGRASCLSS